MEIRVRLFAMQRQQLGWRDRLIELPDGATIGDAWRTLVASYPVLAAGGEQHPLRPQRRLRRADRALERR